MERKKREANLVLKSIIGWKKKRAGKSDETVRWIDEKNICTEEEGVRRIIL